MENVDVKFGRKGINRCRSFSGVRMILFCLPLTGISPLLKLLTNSKH